MPKPLRILNLGAGVQSSTILLMGLHGDLPLPDHCIFADTGWEPQEVYDWMEWLQVRMKPSGVPIHRVSAGNLREHVLQAARTGKRVSSPPFFTMGTDGRAAPVNRSCTTNFKIEPIRRKTKELLGLSKHARWPKHVVCETWLGISYDEIQRMKSSVETWQRFWHPLIEREWNGIEYEFRQLPISRVDCFDWLRLHGEPTPPRSACIGCPYHSDAEWRSIRSNPREWNDAVEFDRQLRAHGLLHGMNGGVYLHRSLQPLDQAPIDGVQGQEVIDFGDECAGVCGV